MGRKEEAYQYLKDNIISGVLAPNQPILELTVAETLQMSRTPIREAMRELEAEGLVVSYPSRGSFVAPISSFDVEEIYELRLLLECWALERSINRIQMQELDEVEEMFRTSVNNNWEKWHFADRKLHGLITDLAGSKRLVEFINILNNQTERIRRLSAFGAQRRQTSYQEHMNIIRSIRQRDLEKAKEQLTLHLRSVANSALEVMKFHYNQKR